MAGQLQTEETNQIIDERHLVVMVRFKPAAGLNTSSATSMLGGVTSAVDGAVSAVEGAIASIPGLNMFITEEKNNNKSETEYDYFKDYSDWDAMFDKIKDSIKEVNDKSEVEKFEFDSTDEKGRKDEAKKLKSKIDSKIAGWKKYTSAIHFIGLGQGGNIINECTQLLADDETFKTEKWVVKSVVYVATPLYKNIHTLSKAALKGKGKVLSFGNQYDLTQAALEYFDDNEKLLTLIKDSNKNSLSLAVGKIKLRVIKVMAIVLSGLQIKTNPASINALEKKFDDLKSELEGMVKDIVGFITNIKDEGTSFIKLDEIPDFEKISGGYDAIPDKAVVIIEKGFEDIGKKINQISIANPNLSLGPEDLIKVLNCLCPVFDSIKDSLAVLKPKEKGGQDLTNQIIEKSGIKKIFAPASETPNYLPIDKEYINKTIEAAKNNTPDMAAVLVSKVRTLLIKATEKTNEVKDMGNEQKQQVAEAIACLTLPMLPTKLDFYSKLLDVLPLFDLEKLTDGFTGADAMKMVDDNSALKKLGIAFPNELKASVAGADAEVKRIKGYFNKNNFKLMEKIDSLHLIYNEHNLTLKKHIGQVHQCIDEQTGYISLMKAKGFDNSCTLEENKYTQGSKTEKENVMPTTEIKKDKAA
jgi:hypothetical protein